MPGKSGNNKVRGVAPRSKKGALPREKGKGKAGGRTPVNEGEIARRTTPASKARSR